MKILRSLSMSALALLLAVVASSAGSIKTSGAVAVDEGAKTVEVPPNMTLLTVAKQRRAGITALKTYAIYHIKANYKEANRLCKSQGWSLLSIRSPMEHFEVEQAILYNSRIDPTIWLDGVYTDKWRHSDGSDMDYSNFYEGYNETCSANPSCLSVNTYKYEENIAKEMKWVDTPCDIVQQFVCEK